MQVKKVFKVNLSTEQLSFRFCIFFLHKALESSKWLGSFLFFCFLDTTVHDRRKSQSMSSNATKSTSVSWLSLKKKRMNLGTAVPEFYSLQTKLNEKLTQLADLN